MEIVFRALYFVQRLRKSAQMISNKEMKFALLRDKQGSVRRAVRKGSGYGSFGTMKGEVNARLGREINVLFCVPFYRSTSEESLALRTEL